MTIRFLPEWAPMAGITLVPLGAIFVKRSQLSPALLEHEQVHVEQQKRDGWRFFWRYVFSPSWRVRYEVEAYKVDVARGRLTVSEAAEALSGPLYWHPCTYEEAVLALRS